MFEGYRCTQGTLMLHLGYFIVLVSQLASENDAKCLIANFKNAKIALIVAHFTVFFLHLIGNVSKKRGYDIIEKVLVTLTLFLYQGAIFFT